VSAISTSHQGSPPPPVAGRWIKANAVAAVISGVASLAIFGLKQALGASDPQAGAGLITVFLVVAAVLYGLSGAAWGLLTGAVLQRVVPLLPAHGWIVLHGALAGAMSVAVEFASLLPVDGTTDPLTAHDVILYGFALGAPAGAVTGGLEALVLRKAAYGLGPWVGWSIVGFSVFLIIGFGVLDPHSPDRGLAAELANQVVGFIGAVTMAVVMLPALKRLQPL